MSIGSKSATIIGVVVMTIALGSKLLAGNEPPKFLNVGDVTRPPFGWIQFCQNYAPKWECETRPVLARDVVLSPKVWSDLIAVNNWVNNNVWPITDDEHWGIIEHWSYPDDGYGDCDNYVLLKRKMLIEAGWPRQVLLITIVRDRNGDGHAVLTVKTDKGELILDNETPDILPWWETSYRFLKRQSQSDPNVWVSLGGDAGPAGATAASR